MFATFLTTVFSWLIAAGAIYLTMLIFAAAFGFALIAFIFYKIMRNSL